MATCMTAAAQKRPLKYAAVALNNTYYYTIIDTTGKTLVDSILRPDPVEPYGWRYDEGIFKFEKDGKYGYKGLDKTVILPAVYDEVTDFVNNAGIVTKDGKMGVVNRSGKWTVPLQYRYIAHADTNGLLVVIDEGGLLGLMTVRGKTVVKPSYNVYQERPKFSGGLLPVAVRNQHRNTFFENLHIGFLNTAGRLVVDTVWETDRGMWRDVRSTLGSQTAGMCSRGIAALHEAANRNPFVPLQDYYRFSGGMALARKGGKNVIIDTTGRVLAALPDSLQNLYNYGGLFGFHEDETAAKSLGRRPGYGLYSSSKGIVYSGPAVPQGEIRDGFILLKNGNTFKGSADTYWFLDREGTPAFGGRTFEYAQSFNSGYAMVSFMHNGRRQNGLLDTRGRIMVYDSTTMPSHRPSDNGWFIISTSTGWGFIDSNGKRRIPPVYEMVHPFRNGYAPFRKRNEGLGYIDEGNNIIIKGQYYDVSAFQVFRIIN